MAAIKLLFLVVVLTVCCAGFLRASSSGLLIIPTAETVGDRHYVIQTDLYGRAPELGSDLRFFGTEFGFGDRFECGVNYDLSREPVTTWFGDAKYLLATGQVPVALGVTTVCKHLTPSTYVIGMLHVGTRRLHLGAARIDHANRLMVGADTGFDRTWTFMADYISGADGNASAGVNCQFNTSFGVVFGAIFPNSKGATQLAVQIVYGGSF